MKANDLRVRMPSRRQKQFFGCIRGKIKGKKFENTDAVAKALAAANKKCAKKKR